MGERSYLCKDEELSHEELYLNNHLVEICKELNYTGGVVPPDVVSRKRLNKFIQTRWLVDSKLEYESKKVFGQ